MRLSDPDGRSKLLVWGDTRAGDENVKSMKLHCALIMNMTIVYVRRLFWNDI
jgi:hypothetical protein